MRLSHVQPHIYTLHCLLAVSLGYAAHSLQKWLEGVVHPAETMSLSLQDVHSMWEALPVQQLSFLTMDHQWSAALQDMLGKEIALYSYSVSKSDGKLHKRTNESRHRDEGTKQKKGWGRQELKEKKGNRSREERENKSQSKSYSGVLRHGSIILLWRDYDNMSLVHARGPSRKKFLVHHRQKSKLKSRNPLWNLEI